MLSKYQIFSDFCKGNLKPLYGSLYKPLLLYASRCLTDRLSFLAEDCVQEAIFKAFRNKDSFISLASLRTFLYTTVHNKAIDIVRQSNAQDRYLENHSQFADDLFLSILENETMSRLFEAIDKLPEKDQTLFFLYWEGKKTKEIAELLNLAESTVKARKAKMIERLRSLISDNRLLLIVLSMMTETIFS